MAILVFHVVIWGSITYTEAIQLGSSAPKISYGKGKGIGDWLNGILIYIHYLLAALASCNDVIALDDAIQPDSIV